MILSKRKKHKLIFTDAGTTNNGYKNQQSRIALIDEDGYLIFERFVGNLTNNQAEILAITEAMKLNPKHILTDSKIAIGWTKKGWQKRQQKNLKNGKFTLEHKELIDRAHILYLEKAPILEFVPRDYNLAGKYLERKYNI
jgi:ribonuclease HI